MSGPEPITAKNVNVRQLAGKPDRAPWHFKVLVGLAAAYLIFRVVEIVRAIIS